MKRTPAGCAGVLFHGEIQGFGLIVIRINGIGSLQGGFLLFLDIREGAEHRFQICVAPDAAVDIVLCDFHHYAGKGDHADQVRDHHETVEGVRQIPGEVIAHDGAAEDQQHEENPVGDGALFTEEILTGFGAVMAPAQHG